MSDLTNTFTDIADAIRARTLSSTTYKPIEMANTISSMCKACCWTKDGTYKNYLNLDIAPMQNTTIKQLDIDANNTISISQITDYDHYQKIDNSNFSLIKDLNVGDKWTSIDIGNYGRINSITYCTSLHLYVAVGKIGTILTSTDGTNWSVTSPVSADLMRVSYIEEIGLIVIGGRSGTILTSTDGINWNVQTSGVASTIILESCAYNSTLGVLVMCGSSGTIITSTDGGVTWTSQSSGITQNRYDIIYSTTKEMFLCVGQGTLLSTSTDGINWQTVNMSFNKAYERIRYIPFLDIFMAVGNNGGVISSDLTNWQNFSIDNIFGTAYGVDYNTELGQVIIVGSKSHIAVSNDAINWSVINTNLNSVLHDINIHNKDLFIIVGNNNATTSLVAKSSSDDTLTTSYSRDNTNDFLLW